MAFDEEELDPHGECRAEIGRLRAALREIIDRSEGGPLSEIARAALNQGEPNAQDKAGHELLDQ